MFGVEAASGLVALYILSILRLVNFSLVRMHRIPTILSFLASVFLVLISASMSCFAFYSLLRCFIAPCVLRPPLPAFNTLSTMFRPDSDGWLRCPFSRITFPHVWFYSYHLHPLINPFPSPYLTPTLHLSCPSFLILYFPYLSPDP